MVDMGRRGSWQAWEEDAEGGVEVHERRVSIDLKRNGRGGERMKTRWSRGTEGRTGWKQAMSFLTLLDGKTLKHTKTTAAENSGR
jgi:hypothetical protein